MFKFFPFLLIFAFHTYAQDTTSSRVLNEVVVSSSRIPQKRLLAPVSIQQVGKSFFQSSAHHSFFDALENVQGVHLITPSLGFKVLNARGFSNTTNVRFAQLVDGMDVQSPHIGGAIGHALGPTDLDIDQVEIVTGVASTLYGMNTVNGLANLTTKSAFDHPGFSFQQKLGMNQVGESGHLFTETTLRYARIFNEHFAFKINASYMQGMDFEANNLKDLNPNANASTNLMGDVNPGRDLVNMYGNESSNRKTISLLGKSYVVARTGYLERDVVDYSLQNWKGDVGLTYRWNPQTSLTYTTHFALMNNVYQRSNRFRLQDYWVQQHAIQFQSPQLTFKLYTNNEDTGNSYNLRSMAENIDRNFKSDAVWYADFGKAFTSASALGQSVPDAMLAARAAADLGRYQPGTANYQATLAKLQQINNWDLGAALKVQARLVHAEAQWNVSKFWKNAPLDILVGADHRSYIIGSDGNYFVNPVKGDETGNIVYAKTGASLSLSKRLLAEKLHLGFVFRVDKNDYFQATTNPRLTALYTWTDRQSIRLAYQEGYRFPSIFEAYSNINSGGVKRVGGLPVMSSGVFENAYLTSSITAFQAAVVADMNKMGISKAQAILANKGLLTKNPYTYIKPEQIKSWEGGYRGAIADNRLVIDADFYYNQYQHFIAQTNVNVPKTSVLDSIPFALYDKATQIPYRVWTNSKTVVTTYGFSAGFSYRTVSNWQINGNTTYATLAKSEQDDGLEDGFNTPNWQANIGISNPTFLKQWGGSVNYRWQNTYYSQSFLISDWVPAYGSLDLSLSYQVKSHAISVKLSGTNVLNQHYYSFAGGPQMGAMYMLALNVNAL